MIELSALLLAYGALAALALAMDRHHEQVWGHRASRLARVLLRIAGSLGVILSVAVCAAGDGNWSTGVVLWTGLVTAASLTVAVTLTYRPRRIVLSASLAWLLAAILTGLRR